MELLLLYWGVMILCYIIGVVLRKKELLVPGKYIDYALNGVIFILVLIMGMRMGANSEIISSLGTIGIQAVCISAATVAGSVMAVMLLRKLMGLDRHGERGGGPVEPETIKESAPEQTEENKGNAKFTILIFSFVVLGMVLGYLIIPHIFDDTSVFQDMSGDWMIVGICILLGLVGLNYGLDDSIMQNLKKAGLKALLFPFAAMAGSILAGAAYGMISSLSIREAAAVSAGFGWYTFAPGAISEAGHAVAGAVSFLHNVIRETAGIIIIPLVAQKLGYIEATAVPGVAVMDICLPVVKRSCNPETVVYAIYMGLTMSLAVPVLVPLLIG